MGGDLIAPVEAVEVVERQADLLQHRSHGAISHDRSLLERV